MIKNKDDSFFQKSNAEGLTLKDKKAYPKSSTELCALFQDSHPTQKAYDMIVVDPPWKRRDGNVKKVRRYDGKVVTYPCLTEEEITSLPMSRVACDNAFIWLWVPTGKDTQSRRPFLESGFSVLRSWGFEFCNLITWETGKRQGSYGPYSVTTESVMFGKRGQVIYPKSDCYPLKSFFQAPSGVWSEKPRFFYDSIRQCFPGKRLDIFGAGSQAGFDEWGYEFSRVIGKSHYVSKPGGFYSKAKTRDKETEGLFSFEGESL